MDEAERSITDVIGAISSVIVDGKYVIGGGSIEIDLANGLRDYSGDVGGREQLAIQKFADALEAIPKTLSESAGMDAIDTLVQLRSKHKGEGRHGLRRRHIQECSRRHEQERSLRADEDKEAGDRQCERGRRDNTAG